MAKVLMFPVNRRTAKGKVLMRPNVYTIRNNKRK